MTKKSISIDLIVLDVILIFQDVSGWKIVKNDNISRREFLERSI